MALLMPFGPSWRNCTTNLTGTPNSGSPGTGISAGANNADGAQTSVLANLSHDVEFLVIGASAFNTTGGNGSTLLDVLVDPAGGSSWSGTTLIDDLLVGETFGTSDSIPTCIWYFFPLWLKSGSSIGAQARTAHTAGVNGRIVIYAFGSNANPASWWCGRRVESIGINASTSQGTNHTPGSTGAYSSWTNLGSTLSQACGALQFGVHGTNTDTTQTARTYFFEFGVNSTRIGPNLMRTTTTSEAGYMYPGGPIFCSLRAGTQLQVRATCSGTAEVLDVAAYAVQG